MNVFFDCLLYIASFGAILALFASTIAVIGWLLLKALKQLGRLVRAITEE